jgi:hypothetical protein
MHFCVGEGVTWVLDELFKLFIFVGARRDIFGVAPKQRI